MRDFRAYVRQRLPDLRVPPEREATIVEELSLQLSSAYEDALSAGASEAEAFRKAEAQIPDWREFARSIQQVERPRAPQEIPASQATIFTGIGHDIRYAARLLLRSPGFAIAAILTLALGIGGCTAIFSLLDAVVLRPLEYRDPDRLMAVWEHNLRRDNRQNVVSPANYLDWRKRTNDFESMSTVNNTRRTLTGHGEPESLSVELVQHDYFPMLGVNPILGRSFLPGEDEPDRARSAIISHGLWTRKFQADPDIIGKSIDLGGTAIPVVGVLPANFRSMGEAADIYTTQQLNPSVDYRERAGRFLRVVGRLRAGVTREQAQRNLNAVAAQLEVEHPKFNKNWAVHIVPLQAQFSSTVSAALWILMAAVGAVLLIAGANVANLLLARGVQRERELAIRTSLGAQRLRVVRQLLTEALLLAIAGCAAGCALAWGIVAAFKRFGPVSVPRLETAGIDLRALGAALLFAFLGTIVSALAPAILSARIVPAGALKEGARGIAGGRHLALRTIVIVEVMLAVVLLSGAGVLIRSFRNILAVSPGFDPSNVLTMTISLPGSRYADLAVNNFYRDLNQKIRQLPGVSAASSITFLPFSGPAAATSFSIHGRPAPLPGQSPGTEVRIVQPRYFETMRIPLLRGRDFNDADSLKEQPLRFLISESLAATYFPGEDPIGRKINVSMQNSDPGEIIGVVGDIKHYTLQSPFRPMVYYPQGKLPLNFGSLVIRTAGDPNSLIQPVLSIVREMDPLQPANDIRTMNEWMDRSVRQDRFLAVLLACFAGLAAFLSALGVYGVLAFAVTQRRQEIGVRLALGAVPEEVRWWIVKNGLAMTATGLTIGLAAAIVTNRVLEKFLFGVTPRDPVSFAAAAVLLLLVAFLAAYLPARRASRLDPMDALRYQ